MTRKGGCGGPCTHQVVEGSSTLKGRRERLALAHAPQAHAQALAQAPGVRDHQAADGGGGCMGGAQQEKKPQTQEPSLKAVY